MKLRRWNIIETEQTPEKNEAFYQKNLNKNEK